jgi:glycerol transport system ATP-binding protein
MARALAKSAPLMLLDEPLVNLDYKLREELREELSALFAAGDSTVIYATTEPGEALLLGGYTAVLDAGELLQFGPTAEVFHNPKSIRVAKAFSDPPMNLILAQAVANSGVMLDVASNFTVGLRASALRVNSQSGDSAISSTVELVEISGSDTYLHVSSKMGPLVAQLTGVHTFELGTNVELYFNKSQTYVFDDQGFLVSSASKVGQ